MNTESGPQVHRVSVKKSEGGYNLVRPEAWVNYALHTRVRLISAGHVEFIQRPSGPSGHACKI